MSNPEILITGGTGSLGKALLKVLREQPYRGIRIYTRDELKQWQLRNELGNPKNLAWLIGDVRDGDRLRRAMEGVDIVINCAAMKQVGACEDNPLEAVKTNIHGAENIIDAALDAGVKKVLHISTDKAVYPVNLYGATKLAAEKIFVHSNVYSGGDRTKFSVCRYGNVFGSRGSVLHVFKRAVEEAAGTMPLTHVDMTRFWIRLDNVVHFILDSLYDMCGGEIFVPKMPSMALADMANYFPGSRGFLVTGIRPGEKIHETLITWEEARHTREEHGRYIIMPADSWRARDEGCDAYTSNNNPRKLTVEQYQQWLKEEGFTA